MIRRLIIVLFMISVLVIVGCTTEPIEKDKIKIGSMPRVFDLIPYAGLQEEIFNKNGVNVEIVPFKSTIEMSAAFISGELDGMIQDVFDVVTLNKEDKSSKLVGWTAMPRMFEVVVSKDAKISDISSLKGKEIALASSSIMEYALDRLLLKNGMLKFYMN